MQIGTTGLAPKQEILRLRARRISIVTDFAVGVRLRAEDEGRSTQTEDAAQQNCVCLQQDEKS